MPLSERCRHIRDKLGCEVKKGHLNSIYLRRKVHYRTVDVHSLNKWLRAKEIAKRQREFAN